MNFGTNPRPATNVLERPTTASGNPNQDVKKLDEMLKNEQKTSKRLQKQVEDLQEEIHKLNFASFTQSSSEVSATAGRLPKVAGVREVSMTDIELGEQIGQGGFSVIHKGFLNGTPVAIKKIFVLFPHQSNILISTN